MKRIIIVSFITSLFICHNCYTLSADESSINEQSYYLMHESYFEVYTDYLNDLTPDATIPDLEKPEMEILSSVETENYIGVIAQDIETNALMLLEEDLETKQVYVYFNSKKYSLLKQGDTIYMESETGERIIVSETIEDTKGNELNNMESLPPVQDSTNATWVGNVGPFHKTTTFNFVVLSVLGYVAGGVNLLVQNNILGVILYLYSIAVAAGSTITATLHIMYYQAHASDCLYYIRETRYYYGAYSQVTNTFYEPITDQSGNQVTQTVYFFSVQPEYTGIPACLAYSY